MVHDARIGSLNVLDVSRHPVVRAHVPHENALRDDDVACVAVDRRAAIQDCPEHAKARVDLGLEDRHELAAAGLEPLLERVAFKALRQGLDALVKEAMKKRIWLLL